MTSNTLTRVADGTRTVLSWRRFIGLCLGVLIPAGFR